MEIPPVSEASWALAFNVAGLTWSTTFALQQQQLTIHVGINYKTIVAISDGATTAYLPPFGITACPTPTLVVSALDYGLCELAHIQLMAM